jgi:hypothetical protein
MAGPKHFIALDPYEADVILAALSVAGELKQGQGRLAQLVDEYFHVSEGLDADGMERLCDQLAEIPRSPV